MPKIINITNNYYGEIVDHESFDEAHEQVHELLEELEGLDRELAEAREERDAAAEEAEQHLARAMAAEQELVKANEELNEANERVKRLTTIPAHILNGKPKLGSLWRLFDGDETTWIYIGNGQYLQDDWFLGDGAAHTPIGHYLLFDRSKSSLRPHTP